MPEPLVWTPDLVARFWDGISGTRLADLSFGRLAGPYLAKALRQYLDHDKRILDFGCGDGDFIRHLLGLGLGFRAAAFEPSAARQATIRSNVGDLTGFLGFVDRDFDGPKFDVICMFEVIEHILDAEMEDTISMLMGLLAEDGVLIITTPNSEDLELNSCLDPTGQTLFHRWQHVRSLTAQSLTDLVGAHGLVPVVLHEIEFSDLVFAPFGADLMRRKDYENIFNTYRKLRVGNGDRLVAVMARPAQSARMARISSDEWSRAPILLATQIGLVSPSGIGDPPQRIASDSEFSRLLASRFRHEAGYCWTVPIRQPGPSDSEQGLGASDLVLYEDHLPLGPRHETHDTIRSLGQGRFSHWKGVLRFSTSDNSDPRANGRDYRIGRKAG